MSQRLPEEWFIKDEKVNATITWVLTAVLVLAAVGYLLSFLLVSLLLAATAAAVAIVPPVLARTWTRTVPWPLLLLASAPIVVGAYEPTLFRLVVIGTGVAALGMLVVVVLQMTTTVRMTPQFAIVSVVLATLAFAGFWAVGSAFSAAYLGGTFVETNDELMYVFTAALIGGLVGGIIFRWYFRRQLRRPIEPSTASDSEVETA
ncbi:hypothetical protein [Haloarchaeobius sp. HRN-SO-5]|uniref:hypothetical protein n=1 Tax=Haloarchaeobius sp. HRN-SO-5 TaxID=3446118 RepID=UPI003EBF6FC3